MCPANFSKRHIWSSWMTWPVRLYEFVSGRARPSCGKSELRLSPLRFTCMSITDSFSMSVIVPSALIHDCPTVASKAIGYGAVSLLSASAGPPLPCAANGRPLCFPFATNCNPALRSPSVFPSFLSSARVAVDNSARMLVDSAGSSNNSCPWSRRSTPIRNVELPPCCWGSRCQLAHPSVLRSGSRTGRTSSIWGKR